MDRIGALIIGIALTAFAASHGWAQGSGDPAAGKTLARQLCVECHAVESAESASSNPAAPQFVAIANTPGMNGIALRAALQTSHATMPNVLLGADQLDDIVAYILSLKQTK